MEECQERGLLILDEVEKQHDRRFVRRLESYFQNTQTGRYRTAWIVPTPLFVSSDLVYPVQAADLAIDCVNWGFRLPLQGMDSPHREEIASEFGPWLRRLQYRGAVQKDGQEFEMWGVIYVPNPYASGRV